MSKRVTLKISARTMQLVEDKAKLMNMCCQDAIIMEIEQACQCPIQPKPPRPQPYIPAIKLVLTPPDISFTEWLALQRGKDSPTGDLACDAAADSTWPAAPDFESYRSYMFRSGASHIAVAALNCAWRSYQSFLKRKSLWTPKITAINPTVGR